MHRMQPFIAVVCSLLLLAPVAGAQTASQSPTNQLNPPKIESGRGPFSWLTRNYRATEVPPINLANSNRLESLLRAGKLHLSLQDAIAMALENNLDIELQRYGPQIADANILRAKAGGFQVASSEGRSPGNPASSCP